MHFLDIFFLVITAVFVVVGIKRGFIGELIRLIAMVLGFFVAFLYYQDLKIILHLQKIPGYAGSVFSFLVLYISTVLLCIFLGWILKKIIRLTFLGWADRLLGALIGLTKSIITIWVLCLSIHSLSSTQHQATLNTSKVYSTYKRFPSSFSTNGVLLLKKNILQLLNHNIPSKLRQKQKDLQQLRERVDSAKANS